MKLKLYVIPLLIMIMTLFSCGIPDSVVSNSQSTYLIICDPDKILENYNPLTEKLQDRLAHTVILSEYAYNTAVSLKKEIALIPDDALCIFVLISTRSNFQISSEWNLWFPELWRNLNCRGKIMIADGSWADEFLNPVKTAKKDTAWVINGKLGHLRKKLPESFLAASCRFDEANLVSRGIDGKTKTPLFSYYFLNALSTVNMDGAGIDIVAITEEAAELTQTARKRGIVSDVEEVLFFNKSEIEREEFNNFPNPLIWNGLAHEVRIKANN